MSKSHHMLCFKCQIVVHNSHQMPIFHSTPFPYSLYIIYILHYVVLSISRHPCACVIFIFSYTREKKKKTKKVSFFISFLFASFFWRVCLCFCAVRTGNGDLWGRMMCHGLTRIDKLKCWFDFILI